MSSYERRADAVYIISIAADLAGLHPQTLRAYEKRGLVEPTRSRGGGRRYSQIDVERLRRIQDLMNAGLNIEGVKRVLELETEVQELRAEVHHLTKENERLSRQYKREIVPFGQFPAFGSWWASPTN